MKDVFHDSEFESFLYGGVQDLDDDIGLLVYDTYKQGLIETVWSCSGHIAPWHIDGGRSTRPQTHWVYMPGRFYFKKKVLGEKTDKLVARIHEEGSKFSFVELDWRAGDGVYKVIPDMKDIAEPHKNRMIVAYGEVPIDKAKQRYEEFKVFWEKLRGVVGEFN